MVLRPICKKSATIGREGFSRSTCVGPHRHRAVDLSLRAPYAVRLGRRQSHQEHGGRKFRGVASELTLLELTVRPLQLGRQDVADEYELLLESLSESEKSAPVTREILLQAAGLRARHRLRTPDAIQVATGVQRGATLAITNDDAWRTLPVIETVILSDLIE